MKRHTVKGGSHHAPENPSTVGPLLRRRGRAVVVLWRPPFPPACPRELGMILIHQAGPLVHWKPGLLVSLP